MNIITRASVKERIHVEQIIRSQPHMHNSGLVDIVTIPVRKCLGLSMDVYKPVGEVKEPLPIILDVHGGGLIAGRKEQNRNLGIQLARRGYIVFIPDYRLVPETDIFGQISDILEALALEPWLYNHCTDVPFVTFAFQGIQNEAERYRYLQWLKAEIQ